jgi:predicted ATPase
MPGRLDAALAELERTEQRWYEAEMHRIRAGILLKRDPANTAAAERSLRAAIAISQSQKARSFELRAALSLAKLYRAANRDADAHAVLAPAVEDFPPTGQFPELTEAQALLAALSESDSVKSAAALRQRRLHLQTSYGQALFWAEGFGAPATSAAFARARELASRVEDPSERLSAYWGLWNGHFMRGEPAPMREMAELFLREVEARPDCPESVIAHRISGGTRFYFGDYAAAHDHFQKSLELYDSGKHSELINRFGQHPCVAAESWDAVALWLLGRIDEALRLAARALADAKTAAHVPTMAYVHIFRALLGALRRSPQAAAADGQALAAIVSQHGLTADFASLPIFYRGWANWSRDHETRLAEMRRGIANYRERGTLLFLPLSKRPWPKPKRVPATRILLSGAWTTRSPSWRAPSSTVTKRRCTAFTARSC